MESLSPAVLSGGRRRVPPLFHGLGSEVVEHSAGDEVALEVERVVDGGVDGQKALCWRPVR